MSNKLQVWTPIVPIGVILVAFCISGSTIDPSDIYLPQLKDKNAEVRIEALRHLQTFLDSRIPEAMLPLLSDEGNSIRRLAARAIGSRWWQIPKEKSESYVNALAQNLRSELEFEDEKNIAERAIGLLTRSYGSKMFSQSPNARWVIYERRGLPCLIDTTTYTEELLGWPRSKDGGLEILLCAFGNDAFGEDAVWHANKEAVALGVLNSRRATTVWIWQHKFGLHKLRRSVLINLLQPKGEIEEPNPITAEIKEWKDNELRVSVGWGRDEDGGSAVIGWDLDKHSWQVVSREH